MISRIRRSALKIVPAVLLVSLVGIHPPSALAAESVEQQYLLSSSTLSTDKGYLLCDGNPEAFPIMFSGSTKHYCYPESTASALDVSLYLDINSDLNDTETTTDDCYDILYVYDSKGTEIACYDGRNIGLPCTVNLTVNDRCFSMMLVRKSAQRKLRVSDTSGSYYLPDKYVTQYASDPDIRITNVISHHPQNTLRMVGSDNGIDIISFEANDGASKVTVERSIDNITWTAVTTLEPLTTVSTEACIENIGNCYYRLNVTGGYRSGISNVVQNYVNTSDFAFSGGTITNYWGDNSFVNVPAEINGEKVTAIGESAFAKTWVETVVIPDSIESIGEYAFSKSSGVFEGNLKQVIIEGNNLIEIGEGAFKNCKSLENVLLPDSIVNIGDYAFYNCSSLCLPDLPKSLTAVGVNCFYGVYEITNLNISDNLKTINTGAFGAKRIISLHIGEKITSTTNLPTLNTSLEYITVSSNNPTFTSVDGILYSKDKTELVRFPISLCLISERFDYGYYTTIIPEGVTTISSSAFRGCIGIIDLILPNTLMNIESAAFYNCDLLRIRMPGSIQTINSNAFYGCEESLGEVFYCGTDAEWNKINISDYNNDALLSADRYFHSWGEWLLRTGFTCTEEGEEYRNCFVCGAEETSNIPPNHTYSDEWKYDAQSHWYECICGDKNDITNHQFNNKVITAPTCTQKGEKYCYCSCGYNYTKEIPIVDHTFINAICSICGDADRTVWDYWLSTSKGYAKIISYKGSSSKAIIPDSILGYPVTIVDSQAFGEANITEVVIPNSITSIESGAFFDCEKLEKVKIPDSVTNLGVAAFAECSSLKQVVLPVNITSISKQLFAGCQKLEQINIPVNVTNIETGAFYNCGNLKDVYYDGSSLQWKNVSVTSSNDSLLNATMHYTFENVEGISLNINTLTMSVGEKETLIATITPNTATNKSITWTTSNANVVTVANGIITPMAEGTATVTATTIDGGMTATCDVIVKGADTPVSGITLNTSSLRLWTGDEGILQATIIPLNASNKKITWASSNTSVATIDENGKIIAKSMGQTTITATTDDGSKTATCVVDVHYGTTVDEFKIWKTKYGTQYLSSEEVYYKNHIIDVSWSPVISYVSNYGDYDMFSIVNFEIVSNTGESYNTSCQPYWSLYNSTDQQLKYYVPAGKTYTISATLRLGYYENGYFIEKSSYDSNTITITLPSCTYYKMSFDDEYLAKAATCSSPAKYYANCQYCGINNDKLISHGDTNPNNHMYGDWFFFDETFHRRSCECDKITETGEHSYLNNVCQYCGYAKPPTVSVTGVTLDNSNITVEVGDTISLTATVAPSNATNKAVSWSSTNTTVATVTNGIVTALNQGTTTIVATSSDGGFYASCVVKVESINSDQPTISISDVKGFAGNTITIPISLTNNPGIVSMTLEVSFDTTAFTLVGVNDTGLLVGSMHSDVYSSPYTLTWENDTSRVNFNVTGTLVELIFEVSDNASTGTYEFSVRYPKDGIYDLDGTNIEFIMDNGNCQICDYLLGDVNGDGEVTNKDRLTLSRYLAKWDGYEIDKLVFDAADINGDGEITNRDRLILSRHLAKWDGYENLYDI